MILGISPSFAGGAPDPASSSPPVPIVVSLGDAPGTTVPPGLFGVNTLFFQEKDSARTSPAYREALTSLAPVIMRYPGGTAGENYLWKSSSIARSDWYPNTSDPVDDADTTDFLKLAADYRSRPLMVINYRHFAEATNMEACYQNAEEWVRFVKDNHRENVRHWEFGNETYFKNLGVDPEHYATSYNEARRRLKRVDPDLQLGLVMAHFWNGGPALVDRYNERVTSKLDGPPDFIILHFYPVVTPASLAEKGMGIRTKIHHFRRGLKEHGLSPDIPIFVTEWNASSKDQQLQGQSIGHLLSVAQGLLEMADSNVQAASFWPLHGAGKSLIKSKTFELQPVARAMVWMRELLSGAKLLSTKAANKPDSLEIAAFQNPANAAVRFVLLNRDAKTTQIVKLAHHLDNSTVTLTTVSPDSTSHININTSGFFVNRSPISARRGTATIAIPPLSLNALEIGPPLSTTYLDPLQTPTSAPQHLPLFINVDKSFSRRP